MKIFVTGGTGFVGRHVVAALLASADTTVSVLTRGKYPDAPRLAYVEGDIGDAALVRRAMQGHDYVVHLAGCKHRKELHRSTNIQGTQNLINACRENLQFKQLIHLSSVGVIGLPEGLVVDERTDCRPETPYDKSRYQTELIVREFAEERPGRVVILRPGNIFGEQDPENHLLNLFKKIRDNRLYFVGRNERNYHVNYIYVKEVSGLIQKLMGRETASCVYIVSTPARLKDFVTELKILTGQDATTRHLPYAPVKMAAMLFDLLPKSILRHPPVNSLKLKELTNKTVYSPTRLMNELQWTPTYSLAVALGKLHRHYIDRGLLQ